MLSPDIVMEEAAFCGITACAFLSLYNSVKCDSAKKLHLVYTKEAKEVT